jgi:hypothetical protein
MTWQKIVLIVWLALGALVTILAVGRKREPITPAMAAIVALLDVGLIALVVTA